MPVSGSSQIDTLIGLDLFEVNGLRHHRQKSLARCAKIRLLSAAILAAGLTACSEPDLVEPPQTTYAVVSGVVYSAAGVTVGNATVLVRCGVAGFGTLGAMATASSAGHFRAEIAGYLPASTPAQLRCRVSTPGSGPALGTTYFEAAADPGSPVETTVEVREGVVQPLPAGWTS